jgi:3-oxoacyl-[acyl-carrier protein] reductase
MEHVARLLTADQSAQGATVNVVLPTALPVGLNAGMPELTRKALTGKMPTGRLVETSDVANVVMFLLSEAAAQINGATIAVDGGLVE